MSVFFLSYMFLNFPPIILVYYLNFSQSVYSHDFIRGPPHWTFLRMYKSKYLNGKNKIMMKVP